MEVTTHSEDSSIENVNDLVLQGEVYLCLRTVGALTREIESGISEIAQETNTFSIELESNAVYNDLTAVTVSGNEIEMVIEESGGGATETVTGTIKRAYERSEKDPEEVEDAKQADMI